MLTKEVVSKLLNRTLTSSETSNFNLYINNASQRLQSLLGYKFSSEVGSRSFIVRQGYRTVYTDVFTGTPTVTVDGVVKDPSTYTVRWFDSLDGEVFNSIVFKQHLSRSVEHISVEADWGFASCMPSELQLLLARLFDANSVEQGADGRVQSKKIEDFTVTYRDGSKFDEVVSGNQQIIDTYSIKQQGYIRNGHIQTIH